MKKPFIKTESYEEASDVFHWANMGHYVMWFTGKKTRHQRTEKVLKRLVKSGKLKALMYGKKLVYTKRRTPTLLAHGLAVTECLVRFVNADRTGTAIPEKYFRGLGSVPEFGILYPNGNLLLFEFSTRSNFIFTGMMRSKLGSYRSHLKDIESKFNGRGRVVFVIDVPREMVEQFVGSSDVAGSVAGGVPPALNDGDTFPDPFYFTDYETFLKVPIGDQLTAPIYLWSYDGKAYPLRRPGK